jgi:hypothetical protein
VRQRRPNRVAEGPEATGHSNALLMRCPKVREREAGRSRGVSTPVSRTCTTGLTLIRR